MKCMYMHSTYAHTPHERTSLVTPLQTVERSVAAVVAIVARPRPLAIDSQRPAAMVATMKRPVRVGEDPS